SLGSLNKAVGEKLMFQKNYRNAIKHLEIARDIRNEDANVYHWIGVCYVNLYKIEGKDSYLTESEKNYKIALKIVPDHMDVLYSYAHLLAYGKKDYHKAVEILNKYIYEINPIHQTPDPNAYFLLARVYYMLGDFQNAYNTYNEIYRYKKKLTKEEKEKLDEFIIITRGKIEGE
ncbi:MAG: hypothetical protein KAT05_02870, partial [Spirochaetes bacterium]|nr:hypothetical protein [Spirochaetota bacterium]